MNLDRISVEARLRSPWEAVDLGVVVARQWWVPIFLSWAVPAATVFTLLVLLFPKQAWLPYLIVWWLKPLWDRGPLYIVSRKLFGENVGAREVFRNLWRLYKTDIFLWLTIRRFSPTRSFDMPLTVLEHLKGDQRSSRQALLHRHHAGTATWLTIVGYHLESFLTIGFVAFLAIMVPEQVDIDYFDLLVEQDEMVVWITNFTSLVAMCLVGPFYATAGFALYISRRIELEAWDVEIRFRHIASVYQKKMDFKPGTTLSVLLCGVVLSLALAMGSPTVAHAQAGEPVRDDTEIVAGDINLPSVEVSPVFAREIPLSPEGEASKDKIFDVLAEAEFHKIETVSGWRFKDFEESDPEEIPPWFIAMVKWLVEHSDSLSSIVKFLSAPLAYIEYILWALLVLVIVFVAYKFRKPIGDFVSSSESVIDDHQPPDVMFGLDVTKESIPDNVPTAVWQLWEQGDKREAVSLFYRALLVGLIHQYEFRFADSNTEGECVAIVALRGNTPLSVYVSTLTHCWQQLAYGHISPAGIDIQQLCSQWHEVFPDE